MENQGNLLTSLLPLVFLVAIFYFLVIRPQQKQQKEHQSMIDGLVKGDKIVTNGGIICEVVKPEEDFIKVKLNDEVIVKIVRDYISKKYEPQTTKAKES